MASKKVQSTKSYRLFHRSDDNRPTDIRKHKKLALSMKKYGWKWEFPMVCIRDDKGNLVVKDGQHRLAIAEAHGLTVHYVIGDEDFNIAELNSTAKVWMTRDFAETHAKNGKKAYAEGLEFADRHKLSIGNAFALLAGTTSFGNCQDAFVDGSFKIKDRAWADAVAGVYSPIAAMAPSIRNGSQLIGAIMMACRVPEFEPRRMIACAERARHLLVPYSTREAYLDMLEAIYNYGRVKLFGLKIAAITAMRERIPTKGKKASGDAENAA